MDTTRDQDNTVNTKKEYIAEHVSYLTRALVKNNIIKQNAYVVLLTIEYLSMLYYIMRLVDQKTLNSAFSIIEEFLDVNANANGQFVTKNSVTDEIDNYLILKSSVHVYINCALCGTYTILMILFLQRGFKIKDYDKTQEQSYILKGISFFLISSSTVLKIPVFANIFIVIKAISLGLVNQLYALAIICNSILIIEFTIAIVYSLKFLNIEVPNNDIAWSHNQSGGIYFKMLLKLVLASQELYRSQLHNKIVLIVVICIVIGLQILILIYRMNTPNIFNSMVHNATLFLESFVLGLTFIGVISLITSRDILTTLAYLFIFIPIIIKIFYTIDQRRKHQVLFKLKNEDNLSSNEYLIALTHLMKMIKRQSETDIAQLLSFTYYHKLYCYDSGCICQFFTQYCQDPQKFKSKKKRIYRGYKDDGYKFIQIKDSEFQQIIEQDIAQHQLQNNNIKDMDILNSQAESQYQSEFDQTQQSQQELNANATIQNLEDLQIDLDDDKSAEQKEYGIMGLYNKGYILRGNAYYGYDKSNQMQQKLDWIIEDSASDILQFWVLFKEDEPNVQKAYQLAMAISRNITVIRDYTLQLEEKSLIKDYNKYYYYAMFYQNLINDKVQYNQMINNLKNLLLVRNLKKKSNRFGTTDINDVGFSILSYDDDKTAGRFLYCNKIASLILNVSEEEVIDKSVSNIMPEQIRINHDQFIKRFMGDGLPRILGKVRNLFIKDFTGYIKPVQFFMNLFYNSKFQYSVILHLDPLQTITFPNSNSVIHVKHCVVFLCNSNNFIQDMTSNARKVFGLSRKILQEQEEILGRGLKMDDVIQQFGKTESFIEGNNMKFLQNHQVRVKNFRYKNDSISVSCSLTYEEITYLQSYPGQFTEKVYFLIPTSKIPDVDNANTYNSANQINSESLAYNSAQNENSNYEKFNGYGNSSALSSALEGALDVNDVNHQLSGSRSASASSSSIGSSSVSIANAKNMLFQQKSPKILKLYLAIVFGVFICFMIVTSINFIIYIQKKNNVDMHIQFNLLVNKRNTHLASTILDLKQLHLISIENQTSKSNIFNESRLEFYTNKFISDQNQFLQNHQDFKQYDLKNTEFNVQNDELKETFVYFLSEIGNKYSTNNTFDYGVSLLLSNLGMIEVKELMKEKIPLNLNSHLKNLTSKNKQVSQLFRNLYYIYTNGMLSLNTLGQVQEKSIQSATIQASEDSKLYINLISFISIGIITIVGIFTFPLLGKIEDRKISVLKFFNILNTDQIQELINKGRDFQDEFSNLARSINSNQRQENKDIQNDQDEQDEIDNQIDKESEDGQQDKQNAADVNKDIEVQMIDEEIKEDKFQGNVSSFQTFGWDQLNKSTGKQQKSPKKKKDSYNQFTSYKDIHNIFKKIQNNESKQKERTYYKNQKKNNKGVIKIGFELDEAFGVTRTMKKQNKQTKIQKIEEELKENSKQSRSKKYEQKRTVAIEQDKKGPVNKYENEDDSDNGDIPQNNNIKLQDDVYKQRNRSDYIQDKLNKIALKSKLKLALAVMIVLIFLNSCLFCCFYLGQKTFKDDSITLTSLATFYHKENCLKNLLLYTVEQYIQNNTVYINGDEDAANYFIKGCQTTEQEYNDLRKALPTFMVGVENQIDNFESSNVCQTTYKTDSVKAQQCEQVYDQIMKRGLTSTLYTIFNYAQSLVVRFEKEQRNAAFLNERLKDQKLKDLIDLSSLYLSDTLVYLQSLITDNALQYFQTLSRYYMIIYVVYMVVSIIICFFFGIFVFKKLKQQIITSANVLAIMPLEELESKDRNKIETFLNS